jgi:ubiquinol-cytochrome c reductase cytochrome b subunit
MILRRGARWLDDRLGAASVARTSLAKVFPDHWSFMLGEIALYCFVTLVLTGVFLTFFFEPGTNQVVYHGAYAPWTAPGCRPPTPPRYGSASTSAPGC